MSEMPAQTTSTIATTDLRADLNKSLAHMLKPGELVWVVEERYEAPTSSWVIGLVRQGAEARWMRQRLRYDSSVDVLFFLGERPVSDEELAAARANGHQISTY
jgi:hypothetical protein